MKKMFSKVLFLLVSMMTLTLSAKAQDANPMMAPLPLDPQVRMGQLPNGLTYYIRHNETPKGQADFYIAQKVGSILENEDQRGLAHFLEHMCFNGTENFEGNEVVKWLETKGVKFGYNLNAYTSVDETVYNISNVPTANEAVQDSCLLILHDWADGLLLLPEEIDKERGVIHQEWRSRNVGQQRLMEQMLPTMYPNSKYGHRMPIGLMEVVDNFPPQVLRDYYETWYRPDQQGVVVVGDIDVDRIENKIKELFSPIKMPENAKPREYEPVPDTEGTIYAIGADPEMTNARATIFFKNDVCPREMRNTLAYLMGDYIDEILTSMLNSRLDEISSTPDSPFAAAGTYYGNYFVAQTKDALALVAIGKGNDIRPAIASIYRELLRALRGGFTISEYDRAREEYLSNLEKHYNNREKIESETLVNEYVRNFIDGTPATGIEIKYQIMSMLAQQIPVEMINQALQQYVSDNNRVVTVMLPEKEGMIIPTEAELAETMKAVEAEDIPAFVDEVKSEPLIPQLPAPGKIVKTEKNDKWGSETWTLSNGAKVVVKKTDFKADQIIFDAQAIGGTSVIPDSYSNSLIFLPYALTQYGLNDYTYKDLQKYTQGKQCAVNISFDDYVRDISGHSTPKDFQTMMELLYANFTGFNITADEFKATQNTYTGFLQNQETDPQYIFGRNVANALYENPRKQVVSSEVINSAKVEEVNEIVKKMTANAADYTFFFVGNIDLDTFRPLVEQYIATIPGDEATATRTYTVNNTLHVKPLEKETGFKTKMQTPQTYVFIGELGNIPFTAKDRFVASIAGQILSQRLLETVREEMGAVYSIGAQGELERISGPNNTIIVSQFPMKPEMKEEVLKIIADEFTKMESDIKAEELSKVTEFMIKNAQDGKERNEHWLNGMAGEALNGVDTFNGNIELLGTITVADVQNFMKTINGQKNYIVVYLEPEETTAE